MADFLNQFIGSLLGGGVAISLMAFLGREWFVLRLRDAIDREAFVKRTVYELKRDTCLEALAVVDAAFSQLNWTEGEKSLPVIKQPLDVAKARACHSKLALTCESKKVPDLFMSTLGFKYSNDPFTPKTDSLIALRNAMREELGFGQPLSLNREKAWIGSLDGAQSV